MCHSGTALDLPDEFTYEAKHVPWDIRRHALLPDWNLPSKRPERSPTWPQAGAAFKAGARGVLVVGSRASRWTLWTASLLAYLVCLPYNFKRDTGEAGPPAIVLTPTHEAFPTSTSVKQDQPWERTNVKGLHSFTNSLMTAPTSAGVFPETSSGRKPPPIAMLPLPALPIQFEKSAPTTPAAGDIIPLPEVETESTPRPASAPPPQERVRADVICIGASIDAGRASDKNSLAKAFDEMYRSAKKEKVKLTHARLLVKLSLPGKLGKGQIPSMSSSYPLHENWDDEYRL